MTEIVINHKGTNYHVQVKEVFASDSLVRYEVTAGAKTLLLDRGNKEKIFKRRWKIVSFNWHFKDNKAAAQFIHEIMVQIDLDVKAKSSNSTENP